MISVDSQGADSAVFAAARGPSAVLLNHRNNAGGPTGIFTCKIPDASGQLRTVYIGVDTGALCVWGGGEGGGGGGGGGGRLLPCFYSWSC